MLKSLLNTLCTLALISVTALPLSGQAYFGGGSGGSHAGNSNNGGVNQSRDNGTRAPANTGNGASNSSGAAKSSGGGGYSGTGGGGKDAGANSPSGDKGAGVSKSSSGGSRAEGNASDRNSVSGYAGGGGNNNTNNSRADGNAADRNSVSGYASDGDKDPSAIEKISAGLKAGIETAKTMTRTAINNVVNTAKIVAGIATGKQYTSLPSIKGTQPTQPSAEIPTTQTTGVKPAEVPDQIKEQLAKMRTEPDVSPEEAHEYEQMDLDAAKRGFQKALSDRRSGVYEEKLVPSMAKYGLAPQHGTSLFNSDAFNAELEKYTDVDDETRDLIIRLGVDKIWGEKLTPEEVDRIRLEISDLLPEGIELTNSSLPATQQQALSQIEDKVMSKEIDQALEAEISELESKNEQVYDRLEEIKTLVKNFQDNDPKYDKEFVAQELRKELNALQLTKLREAAITSLAKQRPDQTEEIGKLNLSNIRPSTHVIDKRDLGYTPSRAISDIQRSLSNYEEKKVSVQQNAPEELRKDKTATGLIGKGIDIVKNLF